MSKRLCTCSILFILTLTFFLLPFAYSVSAKDPSYPDRPINYLLPYGAGGIVDLISRAFIDTAGKYLGQTFVPINRPGGAGTVAAMAIATSKPDGYTLGTCTASQCLIAPSDPQTPYRNLDGFTFIMNFGGNTHGYISRSDAPWKTWKEFIEWTKKHPGDVKVGITGAQYNNYSGLLLSQVEKKEKVKFTFIPFKSGSEIMTALLGGHIALFGTAIDPNAMEFVKAGKARLLATYDVKLPGYEDVPTLTQFQYLPAGLTPHLLGVFGPKGLPNPIVEKLEGVFTKAAKDAEFVKIMNKMYVPAIYMNRKEMNAYIGTAFKEYGQMIKKVREELGAGKK